MIFWSIFRNDSLNKNIIISQDIIYENYKIIDILIEKKLWKNFNEKDIW